MKKKIDYIDGLKGIGCLMVMLGHYYCIYSLAENFVSMPEVCRIIFKLIAFFLDADLGLLFFAIISGYCIAFTKIRNVKELLWALGKRFLRFVIPVLGANLMIYVCYLLIGFHNGETAALFTNSWFQGYYQGEYWLGLAVRDSVHTVIGNGAVMNPTFWVIRSFFYASILVYVGGYVESKCDSKLRYLFYLIEFFIAVKFLGTNGVAIVLGAIWNKEQEEKIFTQLPAKALGGLSVLCFVLLSGGAEVLTAWTGMDVLSGAWMKILYAMVILVTVGRMPVLQTFFANRYLLQLSKYSFGIYALHWPFMCAVSSWLFLQVAFHAGTYFIIGLVSIVLVLVLAVIYHYVVECPCNLLLKVVSDKIRK